MLTRLTSGQAGSMQCGSYCVGFELQQWRCEAYANHLMEWIADYALREEELQVSHANMFVRLQEAAVRVYTSEKYKSRGEVGEITLHAICRDFFDTIPIAPRVFYKTSSNDVVKSFDMVHVRYENEKTFELWLGESKFYKDTPSAIQSAIESVEAHIGQGFLKNEKLLLGPQVSKSIPHAEEIRDILSTQTSLDKLFESAVFPICIASDSEAIANHTKICSEYTTDVAQELAAIEHKIALSGLVEKIRIVLIYVPLGSKDSLAAAFDKRLKGLQS